MDLQLNGTRVLVTGGTRGIGRAIVEAFLVEGATVGFCARSADEVAATQDVLKDGGSVTGSVVDVGDADALAAWVGDSAQAFGGLDVVVANVSALAIPDTEENWQASLNVDLMHTVRLVRAAMPHLERSTAASIIAISSVSGRESDFASGPYGTAKTAIIGYINGLALRWPRRASAPTPSRPATPTSMVGSGRASRVATASSTTWPSGSTRLVTWEPRRRSPDLSSSSRVPCLAGSAAPTSSSMAHSPAASSRSESPHTASQPSDLPLSAGATGRAGPGPGRRRDSRPRQPLAGRTSPDS